MYSAVGDVGLVVPADGVDDLFALVVPPGQVGADLRVPALDLVVDGLADVVQEARPPGQLAVQAQFLGQHAGEVGDLDGVLQDALAVTGAVLQAAQQLDLLGVQAADARVEGDLLAGLVDVVVDLLAALRDDLLDAGRLDAAVGDEFRQRPPRDLAPDGVETTTGPPRRGCRRR